jgi:hypothetical protein
MFVRDGSHKYLAIGDKWADGSILAKSLIMASNYQGGGAISLKPESIRMKPNQHIREWLFREYLVYKIIKT